MFCAFVYVYRDPECTAVIVVGSHVSKCLGGRLQTVQDSAVTEHGGSAATFPCYQHILTLFAKCVLLLTPSLSCKHTRTSLSQQLITAVHHFPGSSYPWRRSQTCKSSLLSTCCLTPILVHCDYLRWLPSLGIGKILASRRNSSKKDNLGEENDFYYNEDSKKWMMRGQEHNEEAEVALPPPPTSFGFSGTSSVAPPAPVSSGGLHGLVCPLAGEFARAEPRQLEMHVAWLCTHLHPLVLPQMRCVDLLQLQQPTCCPSTCNHIRARRRFQISS